MSAWREGRRYLGLGELLGLMPPNDLKWQLEDFYGMAKRDSGLNVLELEAQLKRGHVPAFTWEELLGFAAGVHQMIDGVIVGYELGSAGPAFTLEARDSTDWLVSARDDLPWALLAFDRLAALRP